MNILGIDLGTTKNAVVIVDGNGTLLAVSAAPHKASYAVGTKGAEQNIAKTFSCLKMLIQQLPPELLHDVAAIGITGQMHSVLVGTGETVSPLITWQDCRCGTERLQQFQTRSGLKLREGFGGATLARLAEENILQNGAFVSTISDWVVALFTGILKPVTDPTHAASFGLYDFGSKNWNYAAIAALGIQKSLLPEIRPSGSIVGGLAANMAEKFGLPAGIPVVNAIGDNQASILGCCSDSEKEIYLTIGTGMQLSVVAETSFDELPVGLEQRPFTKDRNLIVSAPLCGGAAFAWLVDTINIFRCDFGEPKLSRDDLFVKLDLLALAAMKTGKVEITAKPYFLGERYCPSLRGAFDGLTLTNATPGNIAAALAIGIVHNLRHGFPEKLLSDKNIVIGSGNAVRKLKCIQKAIRREFGLPLQLSKTREEAASGVAKWAADAIKS